MRNNPKETKNEASSKSSEDTKWENLDPNDPNYKHHQLISKIQKEINDLPHGWKRNEKFGTQRNEPPYIHDDGRVSWKNPNYDKIQAAMEVAKKEEEKEALNSNNDYEVISSKEGEKKIDCRFLKKYRLMVQRGVPIGAVKQSAQVIDNIELDDSDLLETENKKKSPTSTKDHSKLQEEKDVKRSNDSKDRVEVKAANHHSSFKTDQEKAMIKKYKRMMKSGMPLAAIKNMAQREFRVADIDNLLPHFLTDESKEKEIETEQNNSFHYFKISPDGTELEFSLSDDRTIAGKSYLARLVQKMVLTVNRSKVRYNSIKGKEAVITASTKDLYNAIGALRGIRLSRDSYNSVCDSYNSMTESEIQSKRKAFLELLRSLGVSLPTCPREKIDIKGLDELIEYIEKQYEKQLTEIKNTLSVGMYDFDSLVEIYKPGSRVVAKSVFVSGVDMICEVSWSRFEEGKTLFGISRSFKVCFQFIFAVGEHFTMCEYVKSIENFDGRRYLQSLDFIPLFSYDDESLKSLRATFRQRGEIYAKCATGSNYMAYEKGSFFSKSGRGDRTKALRMAGRVMVDTQGSYENGHSISIGNDLIITDIKQKHKEYKLLMRSQKKKMESGLDHQDVSINGDATTMILLDKIPNNLLEMTWPAVIGFSFTSNTWGEVLIDGLSEIKFNESAFDNLVLPQSRKRMVKALVRHSNSAFTDIVSDKGEGSVFLLYGPPGCGKTLTAEAISEMLHRPLYCVSLGQLGVSPSELETKLGEILDLCSQWDALILLDEADIFLEKRTSTGSLERNAMVSVMLRLVEYFKGTLFLTSNRVDALDPAFKTRITLALRYESLGFDAREQVWINLLRASGFGSLIESGNVQVDKLAAHELNGREIKNAIRLAMALAEEDKEFLSQSLLLETIDTLNDFNDKMRRVEEY